MKLRHRRTATAVLAQRIADLILVVRGHRVMLDGDLARLYGVDVGHLKRQVRRNRGRFPADFMFVLTRQEYAVLRCRFGTLRWGGHAKYLPFVFTEQGVAMLSSVLNSPRAINANIAIMRAFVRLRGVLAAHKELARQLEAIERRLAAHDGRIDAQAREIQAVFQAIRELMQRPARPQRRIGFAMEKRDES